MHNFGLAFDIGVFDGREYIPESNRYVAAGAIGKSLGLDWGGDFKKPVDQPHFELRPSWAKDISNSQMLAELRRRMRVGTNVI
jgi:peptidoglycan L-alanyl-D-glutamate endopeptidase CwlK